MRNIRLVMWFYLCLLLNQSTLAIKELFIFLVNNSSSLNLSNFTINFQKMINHRQHLDSLPRCHQDVTTIPQGADWTTHCQPISLRLRWMFTQPSSQPPHELSSPRHSSIHHPQTLFQNSFTHSLCTKTQASRNSQVPLTKGLSKV